MPFSELERTVLDPGLCASCGACSAVCPERILEIDVESPVPTVSIATDMVDERCGECRLCVEVCPGLDPHVPDSEIGLFGRVRTPDERWTGIQRRAYLARARRADILAAASAGGAVTALLVSALESGAADAALVVAQDRERPWLPRAYLATEPSEVIEAAQATYCIAPTLQLLADAEDRRVAIVALPCQSEAIGRMRSMAEPPAAVRAVSLVIELACSSSTAVAGTRHLIENRLGTSVDDVERLRYRDGEYPGEFAVWASDGDRKSLPFHELVTEFTQFKTHRCLTCPDWWSGIADISVADGDPNIFETSKHGSHGDTKSSLVVSRTAVGEEALSSAAARGDLDLTSTSFAPEASLGLQRKRHRYYRAASRVGNVVPRPPVASEPPKVILSDENVIRSLGDERQA